MLRLFKNEIMLMRKKGLSGPFLSKHAKQKSTLSKSVGGFYDVSGAGANFCIRSLVVMDDGVAWIDFTQPPTLGPVGTNGTIKVDGSEATHTWTVDRIEGNRLYMDVTPKLEEINVAAYTYDPDLDGGITNEDGEQLCEQKDAPFTFRYTTPVFSGVFDIPDGTVGDTVNYDVSGLFTNTVTGYHTNGNFPAGLSIDNNGLITGTLELGMWSGYSVSATNPDGSATSNTDTVTVEVAPDIPFVAAYKASSSTQNNNVSGDICNILPRGTIGATSVHNAPILAPDYQGIYQEYAVDDPVWKGGRIDTGETWATDGLGGDLQPYLQCNEAATNLGTYSNNLAGPRWASYNTSVSGSRLIENSADAVHATASYGAQSPLDETLQTITVIVKASVDRHLSISSGSNKSMTVFNLTDGLVHYSKNSGFVEADIVEIANSVYRARMVVTAGNQEMISMIFDLDGTVDSYGRQIYQGDGTSYLDIQNIQTENGNVISNPIFTTTAAASIPKTAYTYPAANIPDPANAVIGLTLDYAGEETGNVMDIGGNLTLKYIASELTLSDGTNSVSVPITAGKRVIEVTLTPTQMTLDIDGVTAAGPYTPVPSALITVEKDHWAFNA